MPCFSPVHGYRSRIVNPDTGNRSMVYTPLKGIADERMVRQCGQCIGCRLEYSRQWAIRCVHESQMWESSSFVTLTYNNESLPLDGSLNKKHFQDFMKRLRWKFGSGIRYFMCGEYGEKFQRPHYHALLFNMDFPDKCLWKQVKEFRLYQSSVLEDLWGYGFSSVGDVTFESAAYVARYVTKKINGPRALGHYGDRQKEFTLMSRASGVGSSWFDKYWKDVYPSDFVVIRGRKMRPPKYYDSLYKRMDEDSFEDVKRVRVLSGKQACAKEEREYSARKVKYGRGGVDRLWVKEQVQLLRFQQLIRGYENETEGL